MKIQEKQFLSDRPTPQVAQALLGCLLVREEQGRTIRARILETEAYRGEYDLACHASKGRSPRTATLYAQPGTVYVYLIHGMHWMLNIVTEQQDFPAAVLIRAVGIESIQQSDPHPGQLGKLIGESKPAQTLLDGPGKLTRFLHIDKSLNGHDITQGKKLWLEYPRTRTRGKVIKSPRIGIDYARHCKHWKWNFRIDSATV
jgi:DNA-3-methyladenine glycosylase